MTSLPHTTAWAADAARPQFGPLTSAVTDVDVAIVGGGITGITAGLLLKRAGKRVAILEKDELGDGDTGRTTSHLTALLDEGYSATRKHFGHEGARQAFVSQQAAIEHIEKWVSSEALDCQFSRVPLFLFSEDEAGVSQVEDELSALQAIGAPVERADSVPLPVTCKKALRLSHQAQVHPLRYLYPLAQKIDGDGCHVFTRTRVSSVSDGEPCTVTCDGGLTLRAKDVIVATYSPITRLVFHTKVFAYRSYVLALRVDNMPPPGLYYDTCDPYHYVRPQRLSNGEELLIVGGEDHKTGKLEDTQSAYAELEKYARQRFAVRSVVHSWSGQILEPADGLAFIGANGMDKHIHTATGYSGTGMTWGTLAGMLLSDRILGRPNPWAELYDANRIKPIAQLKSRVIENIDVPVHLVADRLVLQSDASKVAPGQGALLRDGLQCRAVYRDDAGVLHKLSPVCPHMGCYVKWNNSERSWDCPCHGSRFDAHGKLINGPAVSDLQRIE